MLVTLKILEEAVGLRGLDINELFQGRNRDMKVRDINSSLKTAMGAGDQTPLVGSLLSPNTEKGSNDRKSVGVIGDNFWQLINKVELPQQISARSSTKVGQLKHLEELLGMQNKMYQGGLVVELVSKSADAVIHGVKRLQSSS